MINPVIDVNVIGHAVSNIPVTQGWIRNLPRAYKAPNPSISCAKNNNDATLTNLTYHTIKVGPGAAGGVRVSGLPTLKMQIVVKVQNFKTPLY